MGVTNVQTTGDPITRQFRDAQCYSFYMATTIKIVHQAIRKRDISYILLLHAYCFMLGMYSEGNKWDREKEKY